MPKSYQIALSDAEELRLINRITADFLQAKSGHLERSAKFARYLQRWENRVDPPKAGDENKPNHTVPLTQWQCFAKMARDLQALIGDDAEITARPTGPSDADDAKKAGAYMTSRLFDQMEILNPLAVFQFRRILYGRSFAYRPWYRREFDRLENGKRLRACDYEGPGFFPEEPDNLMLPPERGPLSIQDFSYVIRRVRVTVDELQHGDGTLYQGTSDPEFVKEAIAHARNGFNDYTISQDLVRTELEISQGVEVDSMNAEARRSLWMWEWYGKWRPLKRFAGDGAQDDLSVRESFEADWVVRMIPGMNRIVGCQDLLELYPKMRKRRPFVESSLIKDGSYWSKGFGALLESLEDEATSNSRLFTAAGELCVWPIVFYKPGAGMSPKVMKLEPGMSIPTEDPSAVNVVKLSPDLEYAIAKQQDTLAMSERLTGITDQSLGRAIDRPNAPRTATGQLALIEEGNVRAYLDATVLREDMEGIIGELWQLDCDLAPKSDPGLWFRVTESVAKGAGFDVVKGGAYMTAREFGGRYDFRLKFATSAYAREAQAQKTLNFYGLALQNPLVASNPRALWVLLNRVAKALGIPDFAGIVPEPPDLDMPQTPEQEWTRMLEGEEEVQPNPQDHDDLHLMRHLKQLAEAIKSPNTDEQAIALLLTHIRQTREQKAAKQAMQALTQSLIASVQPGGGAGAPAIADVMGAAQLGEAGGIPESPEPASGMPAGAIGSSKAPQAQFGML